MDAELIAVGAELLRFGARDTNTEWIAERLQRHGIEVRGRHLVEDDAHRVASLVTLALERADVVLLCGGLGPTEDDRTREALARATGLPLERDAAMVERLRRGFERRGFRFRDEHARQADRPRGMAWLDNDRGSAPGLLLEREGKVLAAMPGVPAEMRSMFERGLLPRLAARSRRTLARRTLCLAGRTESAVDAEIRDLYRGEGTELTILAGSGEIRLQLRAEGRDGAEARARLDALDAELVRRLSADVYGRDDDSLASVVGALLLAQRRTVATAESCTAGLLAATLTEVPGSSGWFRGGVVAYADELKVALAGVSTATLRRAGAVSESVALELARGARRRCGADLAIGVTGIAGPGGGSEDKPVGLVHLALDDGRDPLAWQLNLPGDRRLIRLRAVASALDRLRRLLLGSLT